MNRRQAIAALASAMTLPLVSRCTREQAPASPETVDAGALALLGQVAENLLRLSPDTATTTRSRVSHVSWMPWADR